MAGDDNINTNEKPYGITNIKTYIPLMLDLDELNYYSWSELFILHCKSFGVLHFIDGSTNQTNDEWGKFDSLVKLWIFGTISKPLLQRVLKKNVSAHDVWKMLKDVFHDNKSARAMQDNDLHNIELGNLTITEYFHKINRLADLLANIDAPVDEKNLVAYAINGLGDKYEHILQNYLTNPPSYNHLRIFGCLSLRLLTAPNNTTQPNPQHASTLNETTTPSTIALNDPTPASTSTTATQNQQVQLQSPQASAQSPAPQQTNPTTQTHASTQTYPMVTRSKVGIIKKNPKYACYISVSSSIPHSHIHALRDPNWQHAMLDEYNALISNDGSLSQYKARLVANGDNQQQGIECDETFSPIVKPATIRTVLSLAVSPIYLDLLTLHPHHVCLLQKLLHGLKQAPQGNDIAYMLIYVDDIILTASSSDLLKQIISSLYAEFSMTDLGPLNYFLGIFAQRTSSADTDSKLGPDGDLVSDPAQYRSLVGSLQYLTFTRLDLSYAVPRNLLRELLVPLRTSTLVYHDNVSAVYLSCNPVQHQRTKHIAIDIHFVRDFVATGHVRVLHVPSRYQFADIFTKGLLSPLFAEFRSSLSVRPPSAPTAGAY
ncbi:ribonuclease H-like domain-containing protein [Tanacetum coccineum]